jgi:hypothetical protein
MKTGFGESSGAYEMRQAEALVNIITPVLEKSLLLACKYCHACGRNTVLAQDVEYAAKYCAMHTVGEDIGSVIELEDSGSDDDDEQVVTVDDCEHEFTRYEGEDPFFQAMNAAYDAWSTWEPTIPVEIMLKNAIDGGGGGGGGLGF